MNQPQFEVTRPVVPVTVVIPAFNAERFVGRALRMLTFQSVVPSEVIVVDDGSSDNTAAIAEGLSARLIRARHAGQAAARNAGIAAASNDWIALLDVDDVWHPRKLEYQWDLHESNREISLIFTDFDEIDLEGSVLLRESVLNLRQYRHIASVNLAQCVSLLSTELLASSLPTWCFVLPSTVMFTRELLQRAGAFNTTIACEDIEFFLRCIANGTSAMIERPLVGYVQHASQYTASASRPSFMLGVCEEVLNNPEAYHRNSVGAYRKLLPTILLRHAHQEAGAKRYRRAAGEVSRAVVAALSPSVAGSMCLRLAARFQRTQSLLAAFPGGRDYLETIPSRKAAQHDENNAVTHWRTMIADAGI